MKIFIMKNLNLNKNNYGMTCNYPLDILYSTAIGRTGDVTVSILVA